MKINIPKISWSRNDDGTFGDVEDGWNNDLPVKVYWLTPEQLKTIIDAVLDLEAICLDDKEDDHYPTNKDDMALAKRALDILIEDKET